MKARLFTLSIFIAFVSHSQMTSLENLKSDSLHFKKPFFRVYPVVFNNDVRLQRGEAAALFTKLPSALNFYEKYRKHYKVGIYSFAGFFVFTAVGALGFEAGNKGIAANWCNAFSCFFY